MADQNGVNPKDLIGVTKAPLSLVPPVSILQEARALAVGAQKYGPYNWRDYPVQSMVYVEAALRHILAYMDGETIDPETGVHHLGHAKAGLGILLDAETTGIVDNRPKAGHFADKAREFYPSKGAKK